MQSPPPIIKGEEDQLTLVTYQRPVTFSSTWWNVTNKVDFNSEVLRVLKFTNQPLELVIGVRHIHQQPPVHVIAVVCVQRYYADTGKYIHTVKTSAETHRNRHVS